MRKIHTQVLLPVFLLLCLPGVAQVETDTERDTKHTPNQNSIFNDLGKKKNEGSPGSAATEIRNSVEFCPTILFRQKILFIYERAAGEIVTLNFGIGKAFGNDLIQATYFSAFSDLSSTRYLSPGDIMLYSAYMGSSPLLHAGLKIFFSGTVFEGGFFELNYRRERLDYRLNSMIQGNRIENGTSAEFVMNAFSFGYGFKSVSGVNNNFTHEFFMNFGMKNFTFTQFNEAEKVVGGSYIETVYQRTSLRASARILPSINIGYIFGIGW